MAAAHALTDHREIRRWAEARGATPTCVSGTGKRGDTGMIRLDFPGYSGAGKLQPIPWREWFDAFDANNLALMVQDDTADGDSSNFNKLVARKAAAGKQRSRRSKESTTQRSKRSPEKRSSSERSSRKRSSSERSPRASSNDQAGTSSSRSRGRSSSGRRARPAPKTKRGGRKSAA